MAFASGFIQGMTRHWRWWLTGFLLLAALLSFRDYGISWDTTDHTMYGERVLDYWLSGGSDKRAINEVGLLNYYGVIVDLPSAALHRLFGLHPYTLRPLIGALFAIATLPPVWRIARLLGGEKAAFLASLALALMPPFLGHAFINQKDIPLACGVAWCAWSATRLFVLNQRGWGAWIGAGAALGLTLAIRSGALFVAALWGAPFLMNLWADRRAWKTWFTVPVVVRFAPRLAATLLVAAAIIVLPWPYLLEHPFSGMKAALGVATSFPDPYPVLFNGRTIPSTELPRTYLPGYFAVSLQPSLLIALASGCAAACRAWVVERKHRAPLSLLFAWGFLPILAAIVLRPNIYDTIRHFLFTLPAFAVLAGWGLEATRDVVARFSHRLFGTAAVGVLLLVAALPISVWHPYQYAYSNLFAGEPASRHARWENDYWVTSYADAARWINARQASSPRPLRVVVAANAHNFPCFAYYLDRRVQTGWFMQRVGDRELPSDIDYYVSTVRYGLAENFPDAPVLQTIGRAGVTFAVIKGHRQ